MIGRRVLVTGAGSGIGAAIALAVARAGGAVAVNDIDADAARATNDRLAFLGGRTVAVPGDVSIEASVADVVEQASGDLGGLDGLVNNAGIAPVNTLAATSAQEWDRVMRINAASQVMCSRAALDHFDGPAAIVNIASIAGIHPGTRTGVYSVSKAVVISLTQVAALEWGPRGIRVNGIAPGMIGHTGMSSATTDAARHARAEPLPLGRDGTPADIADVAVFLLSDASRYVTGAIVPVDGGWEASLLSLTPLL